MCTLRRCHFQSPTERYSLHAGLHQVRRNAREWREPSERPALRGRWQLSSAALKSSVPSIMEAIMASERPTAADPPAGIPLSRYGVYFGTALIGLAIDLTTKRLCFASPQLRSGDINWLWTGHVG